MEEKFYSKFTQKKTKAVKKSADAKKKRAPKDENKKDLAGRNKVAAAEKHSSNAELLSCTSSFVTDSIPKDALAIINDFDKIIQENRPLNSKQLQLLPENIRELSHQMTDMRSERRLGYMNENTKLSAYVRYFTWWNLVRLTRLFSNLGEQAFPQNDCVCLDLGSGPLTVVTALWLARPELRSKKLTWYCLDVSQNSLTLGEDLYYSVAARTIAKSDSKEACWKIIRIKGSFGAQLKEKAEFITCANMFNELDQAGDMPPDFQSKKYFEQLQVYSTKDAKFILIEPGVPKSARTLALLRERFIKKGSQILSPCTHCDECPMNGFKAYTGSANKWCNLAFSTVDAPSRLQKISDSAKLPKERATLSFICALQGKYGKEETATEEDSTKIRVISDGFRLPGARTGFYACSKFGLTLVSTQDSELKLNSGDLLKVKIKTPADLLKKDKKTGAVIIEL